MADQLSTREALLGMVEALERIGATHTRKYLGSSEAYVGCDTCGLPTVDGSCESNCDGGIARAALAAWKERAPLRWDGDLVTELDDYVTTYERGGNGAARILDAIERHLGGSRG